jgi:hypothetical protein
MLMGDARRRERFLKLRMTAEYLAHGIGTECSSTRISYRKRRESSQTKHVMNKGRAKI